MPEELLQEGIGDHGVAVAELAARLRSARITPAQRAIARFILANPSKFVFMSGAELANAIGVSQPSVSRLAKELGYRGYGEMTSEIRELLRAEAGDSRGPDSPANPYQQLVGAEIKLLEQVRDTLADPHPLDAAAALITEAASVLVLGLRISAPVADHFWYRLHRVRPAVSVSTAGGSAMIDQIALASQATPSVAVVFAMPRYPTELVPALDFARRRGMKIILFVDVPTAAVVDPSDLTILAPVSSGVTFGSLTAAYLLAALLTDKVAGETSGDSGRRLIDLESVATDFGHYFNDPFDPPAGPAGR